MEESIQEFTFESYDAEISEKQLASLEKFMVQAICSTPEFTDLFDDAKCIRLFYNEKDNRTIYYVFNAHDSVTGRNIIVKATNPNGKDFNKNMKDWLIWEASILQILKNKKRIQQLCTPLKSIPVQMKKDGVSYEFIIEVFSSYFLDVDVRKSFFAETNDKISTCANRLNLFCSIISAVQTIHREGICHRDLKPENIMGTRNNGKCTAVLIDFGFALATEEIERKIRMLSPELCKNNMYLAPEMYSNFETKWELAQSADIYALGCMLFELLERETFYTSFIKANDNYWLAGNNLWVGNEQFGGNYEKRLAAFHKSLDDFAPTIMIPRLSENSFLPEHEKKELQEIIDNMCAYDYRKRTKESELDEVKEKLRRIIINLENRQKWELYRKRKEIRRSKENNHA